MKPNVERWDRWDTRLPSPKDQQKVIELFHKSGAKSKSDFCAWLYSWGEVQGDNSR